MSQVIDIFSLDVNEISFHVGDSYLQMPTTLRFHPTNIFLPRMTLCIGDLSIHYTRFYAHFMKTIMHSTRLFHVRIVRARYIRIQRNG